MADAVDDESIERGRLGVDRAEPIGRMGDELGDHRIVMDGDFPALIDAGVIANGDAMSHAFRRRTVFDQASGRRQETARRVLGVDPALDRPAGKFYVGLLQSQRLAGGASDHLLDQIDAGDEFGHRMLDLQAGVHLEEIEASVLTGDKLDGASRIVIDRLRERDCLFPHPSARLGVDERRWRFLDHLLVAALDRAFALAEIDDMAMLVAKHLDLDVARIDNEFLNEHAVVAERGLRLRAGAGETFRHLLARVGDPHALAAAAGRGLDHDRIANLVGDLGRPLRRFDHAKIARHGRDLGGVGEFLRFNLVAHRLDGPGVGADEDDLRRGEGMGERRALGEEPIARMDRLGAGRRAGVNDPVDHEIGLSRGRRADGDRLIGHFDMERVLVGFRIDGDGLDAHAARRLDDAAGDLAAVGDEDLLEHRRPNRRKARASRSGVLLEGRGRVNDRWDVRPSTNGLAPALRARFQ